MTANNAFYQSSRGTWQSSSKMLAASLNYIKGFMS